MRAREGEDAIEEEGHLRREEDRDPLREVKVPRVGAVKERDALKDVGVQEAQGSQGWSAVEGSVENEADEDGGAPGGQRDMVSSGSMSTTFGHSRDEPGRAYDVEASDPRRAEEQQTAEDEPNDGVGGSDHRSQSCERERERQESFEILLLALWWHRTARVGVPGPEGERPSCEGSFGRVAECPRRGVEIEERSEGRKELWGWTFRHQSL
mgnify:FL=1